MQISSSIIQVCFLVWINYLDVKSEILSHLENKTTTKKHFILIKILL